MVNDNLKPKGIRTWEFIQYVTGYVQCETLDDLPNQMQDLIMLAVEKLSEKEELPMAVVMVRCDKDIDSADPLRQWFLHVIVSEIVAADERTIGNFPPSSEVIH